MKLRTQAFIAVIVSGSLALSFGAEPAIGIAMASGSFRVNNVEVTGNTTLFEGAVVKTSGASLKFRTSGGARVELGTGSQAAFFKNHATLQMGAGQVQGSHYYIDALNLRVATSRGSAVAQVRVDGDKAILVSVANGSAMVTNTQGVILAEVTAASPLRFQPQAAGDDTFQLSGCLLQKSGRLIIVDQTTNQVYELRGSGDLLTDVGNRVKVVGTTLKYVEPVAGALQVIQVQSITQVSPGGCLAVASTVGADPPPRPTAPVEIAKKSHNGAIILGVLVAGGAAAGVGVAMSGKSKSQ